MEILINKSLLKLNSEIIFEIDYNFSDFDYFISYNDEINGLSNINRISKFFSISYDGVKWSQHINLTDSNLETYLNGHKDFKIKLLYKATTKYDSTPIFVKKIIFEYAKSVSSDIIKDDPSIDPNFPVDDINVDTISQSLVDLESSLNLYLANSRGVKVKYFRTLPDTEGKDVILNEYNLKGVDKVCDIKVIIPGNDIQHNIVEYNEWGINFDKFEIHVDIILFQKIFGVNASPRNDDFIYFYPINKMYRVGTNYTDSGMNERNSYHVLNLVTYDNDTSIQHNDESEDFLTNKIRSQESEFGKMIKDEIKDTLNDQQDSMKSIDTDIIRYHIDPNMIIMNENIYNNGSDLIKSYYRLRNIPESQLAIKYNNQVEINDSLSYSSWFRIPTTSEYNYKDYKYVDVISCDRSSINTFKLTLNSNFTVTQLGFIKNNTILDANNNSYIISDIISENEISIISNASQLNLDKIIKIHSFNLFTIDSNINVGLFYHKNRCKLIIDGLIYDFDNLYLNDGQWYSLMFTISNMYKYTGIYIWNMVDRSTLPSDKRYSTSLDMIYKKEFLMSNDIKLSPCQPDILSSNIDISNVRFYNRNIQESDQSYVLGHRSLKNASVAYIIDDAEPIFNMPNIGRGNNYQQERNENLNRL